MKLGRVLAGLGGDLGSQQVGDQTILIGGPHAAVLAQEAHAGALLAAEGDFAAEQRVHEPLEAHRHFDDLRVDRCGHAVDQGRGDQRLAHGCALRPARTVAAEQVLHAHGDVVVRVHHAPVRADDAVTVGVRVGAADQIVLVPSAGVELVDQALHGVRGRRVHADLAVVVDGHEAPGRVDLRTHHADVQAVLLVDERPVVHGSAAERIDAQTHAGVADHVEVDDVLQVVHVVLAEVEALDVLGLDGLLVGHTLDGLEVAEQLVGASGDGIGGLGRSRAAGDGVVLEATVGGRVVGRRDDDAVGEALALEALGAVGRTVVGQDGLGDHRGGHEVVTGIDAYVHAVGDEHLDGGLLGRAGQRVGVGAEVQRAGDAGLLAVFGDGLGDGDDVGLVERGLQRRSAVAGGAEDDTLLGDFGIGDEVIVLADNLIDINQICWGGGLTRIVCYHVPYSATFFATLGTLMLRVVNFCANRVPVV